jgi:hypothetical protein
MPSRTGLWLREQVAFVAVLAVLVLAFGYLVVSPGHWSRAAGLVAVAVLLAGLLRAALPTPRIGLLAVRGRVFDATLYLVLGVFLLIVDIRVHG